MKHGDLTGVTYEYDPEETPGTTYTYDRRGRKKTVTQDTDTTVTNDDLVTTFYYNDANQLTQEIYSGGLLDTWNVNNDYDAHLRRSDMDLKKVTTDNFNVDYAYDDAGRLEQVSSGDYNSNYSYDTYSSLVDQVVHKDGASTIRLTEDRTYDKLNRLTRIANTPETGATVSYQYQYNDANQRVRSTLADGSYWIYQYDDLGQVTSGRRYWSDHTPVAGQQFDYAFDDIGNRDKTWNGGDENGQNLREYDYTANDVNEYTQRTVPATFDVLGVATATSTVTVNSQTAYRKGEYFWQQVSADNSGYPTNKYVEVSVSGVSPDPDGDHFIPDTPELYTYDDDGNKESDGQWDYTWDAENRLIEMVSATATGPQQLLKFEYDYMGRRIRKRVWNNTAGTGSPAEDLKFLYDRWNLIAAVDNSDVLEKSFMWGLDLSGSEQGAGGVGGLLMMTDHVGEADYFYGYDGNGNVVSLVWADDVTATMGVDEAGTEAARYEYGPFGETIRKTGAAANVNPCRFSTKYQDEETGLYYYGYRYYDPETGRWINRDPIGERGFGRLRDEPTDLSGDGPVLLAFVRNAPINGVDMTGLSTLYLHVALDDSVDNPAAATLFFAQHVLRLTMFLNECRCVNDVSVHARFSDTVYERPSAGGYSKVTFPFNTHFSGDAIPVLLTEFPVSTLLNAFGYAFEHGIGMAIEPQAVIDPDLLAHEVGHVAGYVGYSKDNEGDEWHSPDPTNLMYWNVKSTGHKHADDQWCEKVLALTR